MTHTKQRVFVAATYDTKGHEADYVADLLRREMRFRPATSVTEYIIAMSDGPT